MTIQAKTPENGVNVAALLGARVALGHELGICRG